MKEETRKAISKFWFGVHARRYDVNNLFQSARLEVVYDDSIDRNGESADTTLLDKLLNDSSSRNGAENE